MDTNEESKRPGEESQISKTSWDAADEVPSKPGNFITSIPPEIEKMVGLKSLYVNCNRLTSVPGEIAKLVKLNHFDLGCQVGPTGTGSGLRYNMCNWPYDWNWNWNVGLKYLNLSGNRRLEVKMPLPDPKTANFGLDSSGFANLTRLQSVGLMDVTCTMVPPDESGLRRVRTTGSDISVPCANKGVFRYGYADSLFQSGSTETRALPGKASAPSCSIDVWDLVRPQFRGRDNEALFALFDGRGTEGGRRIARFLYDSFADLLAAELEALEASALGRELFEMPTALADHHIKDGLRRAVLEANFRVAKDFYSFWSRDERGQNRASPQMRAGVLEPPGCSITIAYIVSSAAEERPVNCRIFVCNAGDGIAVVSRADGQPHFMSECHLFTLSAEGCSCQQDNTFDELPVILKSDLTSLADNQNAEAVADIASKSPIPHDSLKRLAVSPELKRIHSSGIDVMLDPLAADSTPTLMRGVGFLPLLGAVVPAPHIATTDFKCRAVRSEKGGIKADADEFLVIASSGVWDALRYGGGYADGGRQIVSIVRETMLGGKDEALRTVADKNNSTKAAPVQADLWGVAALKLRDLAMSAARGLTAGGGGGGGGVRGMAVMVIGLGSVRRSTKTRLSEPAVKPASQELTVHSAPEEAASIAEKKPVISGTLQAPLGAVALIFTDIQNSTQIWEADPDTMRLAIRLHNGLMRKLLAEVGGYEVKTEGDAFMVAFQDVLAAVRWSFEVQLAMRDVEWPKELLRLPDCREVWWSVEEARQGAAVGKNLEIGGGARKVADQPKKRVDEDVLLFKGLSVRMGIHFGPALCEVDPTT
ncbi:cysteinyl-tRNA synthetase, partial [Cladochytrium tenue]